MVRDSDKDSGYTICSIQYVNTICFQLAAKWFRAIYIIIYTFKYLTITHSVQFEMQRCHTICLRFRYVYILLFLKKYVFIGCNLPKTFTSHKIKTPSNKRGRTINKLMG